MSSDASWYERHILPYFIDLACGVDPITQQRAKIVPRASGKVLEIGIGTGRNLRHYDQNQLAELHGLDPAQDMHRLAEKRRKQAGMEVELLTLSAEEIPMESDSFDTIVCTYTLCTIPDAASALQEMKRVLKPDGQLLFSEHGRAPDANIRRWQDRLNNVWGKIAGGCNLNRDIPALLTEAGFVSSDLQSMYLPGPKPMTFNYWGSARAAK